MLIDCLYSSDIIYCSVLMGDMKEVHLLLMGGSFHPKNIIRPLVSFLHYELTQIICLPTVELILLPK